jgi:general stress protein 26
LRNQDSLVKREKNLEKTMDEKQQENLQKLNRMIKHIRIAMLTTIDKSERLHSCPMATIKREFDGKLYFFTKADSEKVSNLKEEHNVGISYADENSQNYVSLNGRAKILFDRQKIKEFWNPSVEVWFPEGIDDLQLALMEIEVEQAEYWDGVSSRIVQLFEMARAVVTGTQPNLGENQQVNLKTANSN